MKKIITTILLSAGLLATQASAEESKMYVGLDLGTSINTFNVDGGNDIDSDSINFKLKYGYRLDTDLTLQGYYQYESFDDGVYDKPSSDTLNEIGVDLIKSFDVKSEFTPFAQVGIGYGLMSVDEYSESGASEFGLKIGGGVIYSLTPEFDLLAGVDLQYRNWTDVVQSSTSYDVDETTIQFYIGSNFNF